MTVKKRQNDVIQVVSSNAMHKITSHQLTKISYNQSFNAKDKECTKKRFGDELKKKNHKIKPYVR